MEIQGIYFRQLYNLKHLNYFPLLYSFKFMSKILNSLYTQSFFYCSSVIHYSITFEEHWENTECVVLKQTGMLKK